MRTQRELVIDRLDKHGSSMRRFLAGILKADTLLARALLGIFLSCLVAERVLTDPLETVASETATPAVPTCDHAEDIVLYQSMPSSVTELTCQAHPIALTEAAAARAYLIETARPGYTMTRQGPELAIGRLHPAFVVRLANAVREARQAGLTSAGVYSAYRPPAFGIGGFVDKFHSLHTYGLAVDVHGIGGPGTPEAQLWHDIAAKHGILCPYGPHSPAEWNHCQPTRLKIILAANPLRETVTAEGPISLEGMFEVGNALIADAAITTTSTPDPPAHFFKMQQLATTTRLTLQPRPLSQPITANRAPQTGRFPFKGLAFKGPRLNGQNVGAWADIVRPRAIYVEEGRRSASSGPLVSVTPRPMTRSGARARKSARLSISGLRGTGIHSARVIPLPV